MKKAYQLRVRIGSDVYQRVLNSGQISEVVRKALELYLGQLNKKSISISLEVLAKVEEIAKLLDKDPEVVAGQMLMGMSEIIKNQSHQPLILQEHQLRTKYNKEKNK